ncbi:sugar kinase [Devosia pacifica]|uniref:Sugar kinase n=1 Tax=Devosia pacifica TaxID=1335967 RepID=A0A918S5J5_9HYPH|nr:ROK family transcriptional regulator [Devosia pacifica]GHA21314.1 sugar kinase [Devosia pacifica]
MKTADPELMRAINRFHVLDVIRRSGLISRVEIGERTELSTTTISAITASLLDDELISTHHEGDLRNNSRGRPRVMLRLNPDAARIVGAKLATNRLSFAVTNFQGDPVAELTLPVRVDRLPSDVIVDLVEDGVRRCVLNAGLTLSEIKTIALALPGVIEHATGKVRSSPLFRDADVPLKSAIEARLGIDALVESDANAITIAQHWFGQARDCDDFVLVSIEEDLGLGVMHAGQLFRGARELSLALGNMMMGSDPSTSERLSHIASERSILDANHPDPRLREAIRLGHGMSQMRRLIEEGDTELRAAASRAGKALGLAIANLVCLFAPPRVILVGGGLVLEDHLLDPLRTALSQSLPPALESVLNLVVDDVGDALWARGAAAVALSELYGAPWGTTGPAYAGAQTIRHALNGRSPSNADRQVR